MSAAPVACACLLLVALTSGCSGGEELATPPTPMTSTESPAGRRVEPGWLVVAAWAGDRCPHVPASPDPACDPVPLAGAPIVVRSGGAAQERTADAGGILRLGLAPGPVEVAGRAFGRYEQTLTSTAVIEPGVTSSVVLTYGTGIQ